MSIKHIISWLVAGAIVLGFQSSLWAQRVQPFGPVDFDVDTQPFAPVDVNQLGGPMPANTGFFFTYDRLYTSMNRSNDFVQDDFGGDDSWGNRYEIGYMSDESVHFDGSGWLVSVLHIDGPKLKPDREDYIYQVGTVNGRPFGFYDETAFRERPLNNASAGGVEVLKTWRTKPLHYGSYIEPMIGVRWFYLKDKGYRQVPRAFGFDFLDLPDPMVFFDDAADDARNDLVGPEVGLRWFKQNERWIVAAEGRFLAAANMRSTNFDREQDVQFSPLAEIRFEATYEVFRHAALRVGYSGIFVPSHVTRSNVDLALTNDDLAIHALAFGFVYNR